MNREEITFKSSNGVDTVKGVIWNIDNPKFILQIVHGVAEYILRYDDFANYICENGGVVCGIDNLGHGKSAGEKGFGYFSKVDGDKHLPEDAYTLTTIIKDKYPNINFFILGHSMGSFIVRSYLTTHKDVAQGVILSGTAGTNKLAGVGKTLAKIIRAFDGGKKQSNFLHNLAFGSYMKKFPSAKSKNAWIAANEETVELYDNDKQCGFALTSQGFYDLAMLLESVSGKQWSDKIPLDVPYLLVAGKDDPVGDFGQGVKEVHAHMKSSGVKNVTLKLYENMRHEILNEKDNRIVYKDILDMINEVNKK